MGKSRLNLSFSLVSSIMMGLLMIFVSLACSPTYPKCENDEHCKDKGEVCIEGQCQQCRTEAECPTGQSCNAGRCEVKGACTTTADCTGNLVCKSGQCKTECQSASDCGSGYKCENNRCIDELACNTSSDCKNGLPCVNGRCDSTSSASRGLCTYPTVEFSFNEASLSSEAREGLAQVAACIKEKKVALTIEGHCDERGTEEYNLALGDRRAQAVKSYLNKLGVPNSKMKVLSKGENEPLDTAQTEEAYQKNRRAEFVE